MNLLEERKAIIESTDNAGEHYTYLTDVDRYYFFNDADLVWLEIQGYRIAFINQ